MAEDNDISRRYRNLPPEEPPRHVDDAIRAAARRAVEARPAPLVAPTGRQGWTFPLAAAAIIVLAVAVTMHVEREQPSEESVSAPAAQNEASKAEEPQSAGKPQSAPRAERRRKAESADSRELRDAAPPATPQDSIVLEQKAAGAAAGRAEAPQSAPARQPAPPPANAELRRSDESSRATGSASANGLQSPEQWLQRIADLRRQGRHDEADKALADFRKRYPDYPISKEVLEQVEKR